MTWASHFPLLEMDFYVSDDIYLSANVLVIRACVCFCDGGVTSKCVLGVASLISFGAALNFILNSCGIGCVGWLGFGFG